MYNKIFTKILDSSIWLEPDATRIVWLTCIAAMDEDGFCAFASPANLAHRANVTLTAALAALEVLEGPDANSSNPDHEGRRLERVPGGWMVLNAPVYREMVSREVAKLGNRRRVARHRELKRICNASVTPSEAETEATTETEAEAVAQKPRERETNTGRVQPRRIGRGVFSGQLPYDHVNHAVCSPNLSWCVPNAVHARLVTALSPKYAGDRAKADDTLKAWYPTVYVDLPQDTVIADDFKFWRAKAAAVFSSSTQGAQPSGRVVPSASATDELLANIKAGR